MRNPSYMEKAVLYPLIYLTEGSKVTPCVIHNLSGSFLYSITVEMVSIAKIVGLLIHIVVRITNVRYMVFRKVIPDVVQEFTIYRTTVFIEVDMIGRHGYQANIISPCPVNIIIQSPAGVITDPGSFQLYRLESGYLATLTGTHILGFEIKLIPIGIDILNAIINRIPRI